MKIWFDMDGTIADLYGVADWLPAIRARDTRPYEIARGIGNLATIARLLNKARASGHKIGIISWTAKVTDPAYNARIASTGSHSLEFTTSVAPISRARSSFA